MSFWLASSGDNSFTRFPCGYDGYEYLYLVENVREGGRHVDLPSVNLDTGLPKCGVR
jgi:hypothetical protein